LNVLTRIENFRRRTIQSVLEDVPDTDLGRLFRKAYENYGATCLWNCKPRFSEEGINVVIERLQKYGDLRAWYLAADIRKESENARQHSM
jgi:hypothetical protein